MKMPEEVKRAFEVLRKYEVKDIFDVWSGFNGLEIYRESEFRLKPLKPLTVEEAEKLNQVYMPYINILHEMTGEPGSAIWASSKNKRKIALKGLAYATKEEARRHAQQWLDDAKQRIEK